MVKKMVEAIYENGFLKLLYPLDLKEGKHVRLIVEDVEEKEDILALAFSVYDGLTEEEINEIEKISLDRKEFFGEGR